MHRTPQSRKSNAHTDLLEENLWIHTRSGNVTECEKILKISPTIVNHTYDSDPHRTVLHLAIKNKDENMIKLFLKYGADMNARDYHGVLPYFRADSDLQSKIYNMLTAKRSFNLNPAPKEVNMQAHAEFLDAQYEKFMNDISNHINSIPTIHVEHLGLSGDTNDISSPTDPN